ncbi:hypothetical protein F5Y15DRAFT_382668 [Xylariaceae sp. FL0016]|nr:hypothetical protein F5Y15DRAFT_382668 [Xylariaceae sp. FL0016]
MQKSGVAAGLILHFGVLAMRGRRSCMKNAVGFCNGLEPFPSLLVGSCSTSSASESQCGKRIDDEVAVQVAKVVSYVLLMVLRRAIF